MTFASRVSARSTSCICGKEIGIRIALGATASTLFGRIIGSVARLTTVGSFVGAAIAVGVTRVATAMLYGVSPTDVLVR